MTDFPDDLGPPSARSIPPERSYVGKEWLPIGVALLALAVAIAALVVAVDGSDDDDQTADVAPATSAAAVSPAPQAAPTTTIATVQTLPPAPATTEDSQQIVTATTAADSGGEGAEERLVLAVVGIGHDSTLNVRETPGGPIVGILDSLASGIVPTGTTQEVSGVGWYQVHAAGVVGWVSGQYVAPLGGTTDATSQVVEQLGETPNADNMTALGRLVAGLMASEGEVESRVRISGAPAVGDLGEITMDVVGQPDDSIRGFRLRVFGESGDGGFTLRSVESTVMCYIDRGVSAEGLCN